MDEVTKFIGQRICIRNKILVRSCLGNNIGLGNNS